MENRIWQALESLIARGKKDFVIYPYGRYGKMTKRILNQAFHIQERYIVDNVLSETDTEIKDVEFLRQDYQNSTFTVLVAVDPGRWNTSLVIHRQIPFVSLERMADLLARSTYFNPWLFFDPIQTTRWPKIALIECISREVYRNGIEGAVAEAGVWQGKTARFINCLFPDRKLYLFDTFEGFNKEDQGRDDDRGLFNLKLDYSETSEELVLSKMHFPQNCIVKKGWFPKSAEGVDDTFAMVRLDMDLYDPIYAGLEFFYPRMQKGGYIIVHDCRSKNFDGARKALLDFCHRHHVGYMCMPDDLGSAVINIGY